MFEKEIRRKSSEKNNERNNEEDNGIITYGDIIAF